MEPRPWSICLSSSDVNPIISHGDIPPAIQTPASSVTMESAFSLERFSTIAADLNYVLLLGQPLPELLCTSWHISSQPAPSVPLILGVGGLGCCCCLRWGTLDPGASGGLAELPGTGETRRTRESSGGSVTPGLSSRMYTEEKDICLVS